MKKINLTLITLLFSIAVFAQKTVVKQKNVVNEYSGIDKKALQLPDSLSKTTDGIASYINSNFTTDKEKARAIFTWIATNIQYDVTNMFAINFYEPKEAKISKPLKTRKGICENYAALFNDICLKTGVKSYVIEGYTKQNGFTDYIPHAWCAAEIDSSWFLFDPTWGSGYMSNGKFVAKMNNDYFMVKPSVLIKSHMPFDYLWQFLNYPVTNQEFYENNTSQNKSKAFFNYQDSIQVFDSQSHIDQLVASANRIERNGVKNAMIFDRLHHIRLEIENYKQALENERQTENVNVYNTAVSDYNDGINGYNTFIQYRNKQFTPLKPDVAIQSMIDEPAGKLNEAKLRLTYIINPDANTASLIAQLDKTIDEASTQVKEQQDWLKIYFSKGKSGRKSMFYERKVSWFGIPLN